LSTTDNIKLNGLKQSLILDNEKGKLKVGLLAILYSQFIIL